MIGLSTEFRENTYTLTLKNYSTKKCYQKCISQIKEEFYYDTKFHDLYKKKKFTIERRNNLNPIIGRVDGDHIFTAKIGISKLSNIYAI